jgi:hypothetical protein
VPPMLPVCATQGVMIGIRLGHAVTLDQPSADVLLRSAPLPAGRCAAETMAQGGRSTVDNSGELLRATYARHAWKQGSAVFAQCLSTSWF